MTTPLVLTFVGDDRPGLVNAISEKVAACGATWLESRSARLAGKFAGVLLVSAPDETLAALESVASRPRAGRACASPSSAARRSMRKGPGGPSRSTSSARSGRASCAT